MARLIFAILFIAIVTIIFNKSFIESVINVKLAIITRGIR